MNNKYSLLNNDDIKKYRNEGEIVIEPFNEKQLGNTSYDITLGPYYYREQLPQKGNSIHNLFSEKSTAEYWGKPLKALPYGDYKKQGMLSENVKNSENIKDDDLVIPIDAHECILGHSNEFIGGKTHVTTMLKSRSSTGRNNITTCACSGWGDIGYYNRYTLELRNLSRFHKTFLVVNRRYAQVVFLKCNKINNKISYHSTGKYQTASNLDELKKTWNPTMMLPKMYKDYECSM
uniref:Trimeric dUTP diphosphatase n=1 Tax=Mimivirus LCMiAC01 TaxID=2506608 RepID=A0A481YZW6_9VIRU|nr:MAG: trimeric dUTP diphosphatase [Mimivirus LCMiAC01]